VGDPRQGADSACRDIGFLLGRFGKHVGQAGIYRVGPRWGTLMRHFLQEPQAIALLASGMIAPPFGGPLVSGPHSTLGLPPRQLGAACGAVDLSAVTPATHQRDAATAGTAVHA